MLELRVLTPDDWQAWRELRLAALREAPYAFDSRLADWEGATEQRWRERLAVPGGHNLIARLDGAPAGMASGVPADAHSAELISMWVAPSARRRGVGRALIGAVVSWAERSGKRALRLEVKRDNLAALELYRRCGFRGESAPQDEAQFELVLALTLLS